MMSNAIGLILLVCTPYLCCSARRSPCASRLFFVNKPVSCTMYFPGSLPLPHFPTSLATSLLPYSVCSSQPSLALRLHTQICPARGPAHAMHVTVSPTDRGLACVPRGRRSLRQARAWRKSVRRAQAATIVRALWRPQGRHSSLLVHGAQADARCRAYHRSAIVCRARLILPHTH